MESLNNRGNVLSGRILSKKLRTQLKDRIDNLNPKMYTRKPHLVAVLVGSDSASQVYIRQKEKACIEVGINFTLINLKEESTTKEVLETVAGVNQDDLVDGCLVQLPMPKQIDQDQVIESMAVEKDVDCFHPINIGKMVLNQPRFIPATPYGIQMMIEDVGIKTQGKHCVIIGKSLIVGQPLMNLMSLETGMGATVTCCDKHTEDLAGKTRQADILIVAAGKHHLINDLEMIKDGAVVIDVGIHRIDDSSKKNGYRLEGDVNYKLVKEKCSHITPVPGGVGPMTVVALLYNTFNAFKMRIN